jgi:UDP-GlcNAc:undecaprenyl-phosphate GlcNAc-1-phosphate transferase
MKVSFYLGAAIAFIGTLTLILGGRPVAKSIGLVDVPNERKIHQGAIPLIGGVAIFVAVLLAQSVEAFLLSSVSSLSDYISFYIAGALLVLVGVVDDFREVSPRARIACEIIAALIVVYGADTVVRSFGSMSFEGGEVGLGVFAVPFTVFAIVSLINAVNMSDGLDGLAGTLTLVPVLGFIAATVYIGNGQDLFLVSCFAASILAFLLFNVTIPGKRRALIFLGDSGSMLLGLALAWFAIRLSQGDNAAISPAATLWFFALPVYDTVCMTARRLLRRRSLFSADKEHIHHVFLLAGFTVTETVVIMGSLAVFGVIVGLAGTYYEISDLALAGAFLILGLMYFWAILRAWTVMRFLRRSICRRRDIRDRRVDPDRRSKRVNSSGPERRQQQRRAGERRSESRQNPKKAHTKPK